MLQKNNLQKRFQLWPHRCNLHIIDFSYQRLHSSNKDVEITQDNDSKNWKRHPKIQISNKMIFCLNMWPEDPGSQNSTNISKMLSFKKLKLILKMRVHHYFEIFRRARFFRKNLNPFTNYFSRTRSIK